FSEMQSHYWWEGKVETATEVPVYLKTHRRNFSDVEKVVKELHSYECPCLVALPIEFGSKTYLNWLDQSSKGE
ncbi:MAG: divalent-cation tolerance protein CutA, partial [Bdellovibrionales bacterium]|nr:divalent-cation tolerance protein CutA [Bdellovibrionales bacterium]